MGAQKSIHAGKAKIDVNVDFTHKLCAALMLQPFRNSGSPLELVIGSLCIKHPNLFGKSEKLDVLWDKGLYDSNILITYRKPRPEWLPQQSFIIQHSVSPEIGVHGLPVDNFSRSGSGGVNLCRFSAGLDLSEPASSNWSSKTSHIRPVSDEGRSINRDLHGFPVTCSGGYHDSMVVVKQESRYAKANDRSFTQFSLQIEQGIPILSKWLIFNRFKFAASRGLKLGPAFLLTSLTGGSIVGDIAPYQAFAIGGLGSVRGYGEGAVGCARSCLVANNELTFPLVCFYLTRCLMVQSSWIVDLIWAQVVMCLGIPLLGMANQELELVLDMALDSSLSWDISRWTMQSMHFNNGLCTSASVTSPHESSPQHLQW
ncbi:PREDICTED: outer envelope protein 80, chloroplastic isoform X2 [Nicotiana attenuata]|uniref:outer envelope protein 80, chloroplastic isoform X2 n=1 Tax=Nicotiana attenuata TaxID=49451 RepID=UPI000904F123|nr:PREDICTED: outer envelope protein 80, chloroplastic isoform X2 [Nicotiana attenuata]